MKIYVVYCFNSVDCLIHGLFKTEKAAIEAKDALTGKFDYVKIEIFEVK